MKKSNLFLIITLVLLVVFGWFVQVSNFISTNKEFAAYLGQAEQFNDAGLYQKALQQYESALKIKEKDEVRKAWFSTYEKAYEEGFVGTASYINALEEMSRIYIKSPDYRELLLQIYMSQHDLDSAYDLYMECLEEGLQTDLINEIGEKVVYSFSVSHKVFTEYVRCSAGYYMVNDGKGWGVIRPNGDTVYDCDYEYVSPYNDNYQALFVSSKGKRVYNSSIVLEATVEESFAKTGTYVNGIIALCDEDGLWRFYDCSAKTFISDKYVAASNFSNGVAGVCTNNAWTLIDTEMSEISQERFSDIKLHGNNDYSFGGVMIAAVDGNYGIFDSQGNRTSSFSCKNADVYLGEAIAFQGDNDLWGYVGSDGNIIIEPQYDKAKSFSNGLGAVCVDGKWGFINTAGKIVIETQFLDVDYFTSGKMCLVSSVHGQYYKIILKY